MLYVVYLIPRTMWHSVHNPASYFEGEEFNLRG